MERKLPVYTIEGTEFVVDVANLQLQERANPGNMIPLFDMRDTGDGYVFDYSPTIKNIPELFSDDPNIKAVIIPELVQIDPVGMAEKYGISMEAIEMKSDFDIMVDQQALQQRLSGQLPTVSIAGHIFYVDERMDMLRPKDDFLSTGIVFSQIDHYYDDEKGLYTIPYSPQRREFREPDYDNITALPKDLIVVSFPHEIDLDPVGFNRKHGFEETNGLKESNIRSHFEAKIIDWKETGIEQVIEKNKERLKQKQQEQQQSARQKNNNRQRKGPKL